MAKRNPWLEQLQRKYARDMEAQSIVIQYWIRQGMLDATTLALHRHWGWGEKRLTDLNKQIGGIYCDEVLYGLGDAIRAVGRTVRVLGRYRDGEVQTGDR